MGHGPGAEWYAEDKFLAAEQNNWEGKSNWRAYAHRCKKWWEADGSPMVKPAKKSANGQDVPVYVRKRAIEDAISTHPANRDSVHYDQRCTDLQKANLRELRTKLSTLTTQIANG